MIKRSQVEADAKVARELLVEAVRPFADVPILLSGGMDSATLLFSLLELGRKPSVFTFRLERHLSEDFTTARDMAKTFDLPFYPIVIPESIEVLIADVRRIVSLLESSRKTWIQCAHPFLYIPAEVRSRGFDSVLWAGCLDYYFGASRKAQVAYKTKGEESFLRARLAAIDDPNSSDFALVKTAKSGGIDLIDVFLTDALRRFFFGLTFRELHFEREKGFGLFIFPEYWKRGAWYRKKSNFQINSKIREYHDRLLRTEYNKRNARAVVAVYNDVKAGRI